MQELKITERPGGIVLGCHHQQFERRRWRIGFPGIRTFYFAYFRGRIAQRRCDLLARNTVYGCVMQFRHHRKTPLRNALDVVETFDDVELPQRP